GVLARTDTPFHDEAWKPDRPLSASDGTSGRPAKRRSVITASGLTARLRIWDITGPTNSTASCTSFPRRALITAAVALYGTDTDSIAARALKSSAARLCVLPMLT